MNRTMEAIIWAMNVRGLQPGAWKMLVMLARRVGKRGFDVWPSHKQIAEDAEISVSSARRFLQELVDEGYLEIIPGERTDGGRSSNTYRLQVRMKMKAAGDGLEIEPDDLDDEDGAPVHRVNTPPVQIEQGALLTGEQCNEHIPDRTNSSELPPSPNGEGTPHGEIDLFGHPVEPEPEQPIEQFVLERWAELKAAVPVIPGITVLSQARLKKIHARDADAASAAAKLGISPREVWVRVFEAIPRSGWLCGRNPPGPNYSKPHVTDIDEVLRPLEFLKILEGAHDDRPGSRPQKYDPDSGRSYGPVEQASRSVLADRRARRAESRERGYPGRGAGADHPRLSHNPG